MNTFYARNEIDFTSFELMGITQSEFEKSIKDHSVRSVAVIEIDDNFGNHYSARVNLISQHDEPSAYLLTSDRHRVLYYENIDNLITVLQDLGYKPPKAGLNIVEVFSEF